MECNTLEDAPFMHAVTTRKKKIEQTSSLIGLKLVKFRNQELVKPCHEQHTFKLFEMSFQKLLTVSKLHNSAFLKIVGIEAVLLHHAKSRIPRTL